MTEPRLQRVKDQDRRLIEVVIDGWALSAMEGDTILVAILAQRAHLREPTAGEQASAGFCLMGACQDCWVWLEDGRRIRACTTYVEPGLRIRTTWPDRLLAS
ncbi:MAG: (2Fe-2S)-binding protein [Dongiaceae bacterium]